MKRISFEYIEKSISLLKVKKGLIGNIMSSLLFKGGTSVISFLMIRMCFNNFADGDIGIWMTLSSILVWFNFFDFGLGNGMRNDLTKALIDKDVEKVKFIVSSSYISLLFISIALILGVMLLDQLDLLHLIFGMAAGWMSLHENILAALFIGTIFQIYFKLVLFLYIADGNFYINGLVGFLNQLGVFIVMMIFQYFGLLNLLNVIMINTIVPLVIILVIQVVAFTGKYKAYIPRLSLLRREYLNDILKKGILFFTLQLFWMMLTTADVYLISFFFGELAVLKISLFFKIFTLLPMMYFLVIGPFWTAFTEAYHRGEFEWIKSVILKLNALTLLFVMFGFVMLFLLQEFISLWIGRFDIESDLNAVLVLTQMLLIVYLFPFNYLLNGTGNIKVQTLSVFFGFCFKIFVVFMLDQFAMLSPTIILLLTIVSLIPSAVTSTVQVIGMLGKPSMKEGIKSEQ